ncbi:MAG TPA: rRNA maturation RNase YbeY [Pyrinomonadaceae bacterium]|jgi:probable rRNA maturation factor
MSEIINQQRKIKFDWQILQSFAEAAIDRIPEAQKKSAAIAFVSDRKMRELNVTFRGKNSTTDVLSFPFEADEFEKMPDAAARGFLGDIIISAEQAEKQSKENNLDFETEIKQLILHGILHLCGYDHESDGGEMNAKELELRDKLGI